VSVRVWRYCRRRSARWRSRFWFGLAAAFVFVVAMIGVAYTPPPDWSIF
jgi:predicted small integral membrane protein